MLKKVKNKEKFPEKYWNNAITIASTINDFCFFVNALNLDNRYTPFYNS